MKIINCPACSSVQLEKIEELRVDKLVELYLVIWKVDILPYVGDVNIINLTRCSACDVRFFDPPCCGDASFYALLQQFDWYYQDEKPEYSFALSYIGSDSQVLEIGCGKGSFGLLLPKSVSYTGLEINEVAVANASEAGLNVLEQSIEEHVASSSKTYDVVCAFQVLEHIIKPDAFLRGCTAALKPGGTLILAVPAEDSYISDAPNAVLNMPPHHAIRWSDHSLRSMARREGLNVVELWHEPITPDQYDWYMSVMARSWFTEKGLLKKRYTLRGHRLRK